MKEIYEKMTDSNSRRIERRYIAHEIFESFSSGELHPSERMSQSDETIGQMTRRTPNHKLLVEAF